MIPSHHWYDTTEGVIAQALTDQIQEVPCNKVAADVRSTQDPIERVTLVPINPMHIFRKNSFQLLKIVSKITNN